MAYENELDRELGESERAARVYRDIDAYVNKGGRDLEEEHLALAQSGEEKEKIRNLWHKGRRARLALVGARFDALRPKIEEVANDPNLGALLKKSDKPAPVFRRYAISDHVVKSAATSFLYPRHNLELNLRKRTRLGKRSSINS